ncbi:MAG: sulfatase [Planctomycetes bacterium]|nr:sulfatase [Planctomycetota bacterium]
MLRLVVLALVLAIASIVAAQRAPNLVLLLTDDQRHDAMACAGHPFLQTPHIDSLAHRGVRFVDCFVTTPICAASRASILTGTWERTHGYTFGKPPLSAATARDAWPMLLRAAGYRTGFVGKWGVRNEAAVTDAMWDSFHSMAPPYLKAEKGGGTRHLTDLAAERAIEFLREGDRAQPFCLMVSFNAPHAEDSNPAQYIPPPSLRGLYDEVEIPVPALADAEFFAALPEFQRRSLNRVRWGWRFDTEAKRVRMVRDYCAMITGVDRAVGRILDELHAISAADETIVVFTSDNGCFLGERGFAGKWTIHEESIRVPLIVHDPRPTARPAATLGQMVLNVDLAPTLLAFAGIEIPASYQGSSLVPLLRGETPKWREDFFCEHLFDHPQIPKHEGVRGRRWVYTRYFEQDPVYEELYDLGADPQQRNNLAKEPAHAGELTRMRDRCDELRDRYRR